MDRAMIHTCLADELDRRTRKEPSKRGPDPVDLAIATTKDRIAASVAGPRLRVSARLKDALCA